ncbi:MAG: hypothetical protein IJV76_05755 [Clostridia bacterium]|nr:hypothetical protein [Clostridia bacterium]
MNNLSFKVFIGGNFLKKVSPKPLSKTFKQKSNFGIFKNGMNEHNKKVQENSLPFHIQNLFEEILKNNIPVDLKYDIADKYIVQVKLSTLYKYFNINKDNKNETKKFSNALYNISDFRRDNAIIEQGKTFNFILVEPIL